MTKQNKIKKTILNIFLLIGYFLTYGQDLPVVVPKTPNVSALMKFLETPVSLSTGIPSVNIPIFTIENGMITAPISLGYHSGGVKVNDVASWVGMGWNLNAGGLVTRTVKSSPDDLPNGIMNNVHFDVYFAEASTGTEFIEKVISGRDFEPDEFTFNFMGYSGSFIYNSLNNELMQAPLSKIKITPRKDVVGGIIKGWEFTLPNGVIYYFGQTKNKDRIAVQENLENTLFTIKDHDDLLINSGGSFSNFINTWHLVEVISSDNRDISFHYKANDTSERIYKRIGDTYEQHCTNSNNYTLRQSVSSSIQNQLQLTAIFFNEGKILFEEQLTNRLDTKSKALKSISIYAKNQLISKVSLDYFYSESVAESISAMEGIGDSNMRRFRLFLDNVTFKHTNKTNPPYAFFYTNVNQLPSRFSNAQDHWGYYNGKLNNNSLIPKMIISSHEVGISDYVIGHADRTVDTINNQAGILNKVVYPTGGYASYEYESNTIAEIEDYLIKKAEYTGDYSYNLRNREESFALVFSKSPGDVSTVPAYDYATDFTVSTNVIETLYNIEINSQLTGCNNWDEPSCDYLVRIIGVSNPSYEKIINRSLIQFVIPPGDYKIVANLNSGIGIDTGSGTGATETANFNVVLKMIENPFPDHITAGGLRVKKIIIFDGEKEIVKKYKYHGSTETVTSGILQNFPSYVDYFAKVGSSYNCNSTLGNKKKITSYNKGSGVYGIRKTVLYEKVMEFIGDKIKKEYQFTRPQIYISSDYESIFPDQKTIYPNIILDWESGRELQSKYFIKKPLGEYILTKHIVNNFNRMYQNEQVKIGFKLIRYEGPESRWAEYSAFTAWHTLNSTTTTNYFDSGNISTTKNFLYDSDTFNVKQKNTTTSLGETFKTKYYYARDLNEVNLDNQYRISVPLKTEVYKNEALKSSQLTTYKNWGNNIYSPEFVFSKKGAIQIDELSDEDKKLIFHSYDSIANPLEVSKKDGTHTYYIWGYNQTKPIAKLDNFTAIEALSMQVQIETAIAASNLDTDRTIGATGLEGNLRTALEAIRTALPNNATMSSYTYDPLIGVTSITDIRGQTVYYKYDSFNRLQSVKDIDGKLVTDYIYHYKNQQ